ncbi:MAG: FAD-binding oxidoreductase [SAR324 cluster bacterium]|nr:FAD-binding oxidoreductase [SAR324 cluster bacterium]
METTSLEETQKWIESRIATQQQFRICGTGSRIAPAVSEKSKPEDSDTLALKKLNTVCFFDPDDMVVGIEAGMSISSLQQLLAEKKMVLPVNPWFPDSCVGSVVSCNDFGANRMDMGGLRDSIIGIEYINGKAEIVQAGGKVVKNVSGYDLTRMMLGSQGGLGVITAVNFKVTPLPVEPHGMFGKFQDESWIKLLEDLHKQRIPLDWIQAVSTSDLNWILGLGYSGNQLNRKRIESEIGTVFGSALDILPDGESFPGQNYTPGEQRFTGFLAGIRDSAAMQPSSFHVMATLPTNEIFNFPFETFRRENFLFAVHPAGGDIHFMQQSSDRTEQLQYLEKIKTALIHTDSKLRWVSGAAESSFEELGNFGVANGYSLAKRLKKHLDPAGVFVAPYYNLDFEK